MKEVIEVFCDGSGFNENTSAYCVIVINPNIKIKRPKKHVKVFDVPKDSYEIEYLALIKALEISSEIKGKIIVKTDNEGVYREVNLKKEPRRREFFLRARELLKENSNISVIWIKRDKNLAGEYLEERLEKLKSYRCSCCGCLTWRDRIRRKRSKKRKLTREQRDKKYGKRK